MKKIIILLITIITATAVCVIAQNKGAQNAQASAQSQVKKSVKKTEVIKGKIASIDTAKGEITIKRWEKSKGRIVKLNVEQMSPLKAGYRVKIEMKDNIAEKIEVIIEPVTIQGEITSINSEKNEITIKTGITEKIITVPAPQITALKIGNKVKVKMIGDKFDSLKVIKNKTLNKPKKAKKAPK